MEPKNQSVFFNKLINAKIKNKSGRVCGKFVDIAVSIKERQPIAVALCIKKDDVILTIDWKSVEIFRLEKGNEIVIRNTNNLIDLRNRNDIVYISTELINKQIVDIKGRKVERIFDVRLANIKGILKIIAVDVGMRGRLRKRGIEHIISRIARIFKIKFRNKLVVWDDLHPVITSAGLELTTIHDKLKKLHAADLADIIEELDSKERENFFKNLDIERAADVLEEIEPEVQRSIIKSLPVEYVSDILEVMPTDEAADILEDLEESISENLLSKMETKNSGEIRELMSYEEKTVGSVMSKDYITFLPDVTIQEVVEKICYDKPTDEEIPYVYVVNSNEKLLGVISLTAIIMSEAEQKIYEIMQANVVSIQDEESIKTLTAIFSKYPFMAIPVIDENKQLIGVVHLRDIFLELI